MSNADELIAELIKHDPRTQGYADVCHYCYVHMEGELISFDVYEHSLSCLWRRLTEYHVDRIAKQKLRQEIADSHRRAYWPEESDTYADYE